MTRTRAGSTPISVQEKPVGMGRLSNARCTLSALERSQQSWPSPSTVPGDCAAPRRSGAWCARPSSSRPTSSIRSSSSRAVACAGRSPRCRASTTCRWTWRSRRRSGRGRSGVPSVILFGIPGHKDPRGTGAWAEDGIVQKALRALKELGPRAAAHRRRVPLRVHRPRPLRRHPRRRGGQRPDACRCSRRWRSPAPRRARTSSPPRT